MQYIVASIREQLQEYHKGAYHWRQNIVAVITQDKVIDDNLKRQIENLTSYTYGLFLLV